MIEQQNLDLPSVIRIYDPCACVYKVLDGETRTRCYPSVCDTTGPDQPIMYGSTMIHLFQSQLMNAQQGERLTASLPNRNTDIRIHQSLPPLRYRACLGTVQVIPSRKRTAPRRRFGVS